MDVQRLRTFRSVLVTGSVRGAAEALGYSPASVSQQLTRLQRETGLILFSRTGRGLEPTSAGHALGSRVESFLGEVADLEAFAADLREGRKAVCTLCYVSSLGSVWMPQITASLRREFPDVEVELRVRDEYDPQQRPQADVQLVAHAGAEPAPTGYRRFHLTTDPFVVAIPAEHALATSPEPMRLELLDDVSWIDINAGRGSCRQIALDACTAAGFTPRMGIQAEDYATALALVAAGIGVCVLPSIAVSTPPRGAVIRSLTAPAPHREISALVATESLVAPATRRALDLAREAAQAPL